MTGRRDVWIATAEQARGAVRFLMMVGRVEQSPGVRTLSEINRIGDKPQQLDAVVMGLVRSPNPGVDGELDKADELEGEGLL